MTISRSRALAHTLNFATSAGSKMEESMLSSARADDKRIPDRAGRAEKGSQECMAVHCSGMECSSDCNSQGAWRRKEEVTTCADSPHSFFSSPDDYMCCRPSFFCFCFSSTAAEPDSVRPVSYSLIISQSTSLMSQRFH